MPTVSGPVVLVLFDGWAYRGDSLGNAIAEAETPHFDQLWDAYPHVLMAASGAAVGLSEGAVGSAAASYATIAAGRPVEQPQLRLDRALESGDFAVNPVICQVAREVIEGEGRLHLFGLVSDGQVVTAERHYFALLSMLKRAGVPGDKVFVHAVLDGYDTPSRSGMNYLARFAAEMMRTGLGRVATLMGRRFGLASAGNWDATERAYAAIVEGAGRLVPSAIQAIQAGYSRGEDDATLSPAVVLGADGLPLGQLRDGDHLICFNYREAGFERLARALKSREFSSFDRERPPDVQLTALTSYAFAEDLGLRVAFPAPPAPPSIGERLTASGKRIGLVLESVMEGQIRRLTRGADAERVITRVFPSPAFDEIRERPERLTDELTAAAVELIEDGGLDLIVVDYVNADLAGHFGQMNLAVRAVESLDAALSPLVRTARKAKATLLLSACYGNVEELSVSGVARPNPAHTANPVPLVLINDAFKGLHFARRDGYTLADLPATVLELLGMEQPGELQGRPLVSLLTPLDSEPEADLTGPAPVEISASEGIAMVIQVERETKSYYLTAADAATDLDSAALYRHLAAESERRLQALERRYELLESARLPLAEAPQPVAPAPDLPPLEVLEVAIREELDTHRILTDIVARNLEPQGRAVLEQIATEELAIVERLQKLAESEAIRLLSALPAESR